MFYVQKSKRMSQRRLNLWAERVVAKWNQFTIASFGFIEIKVHINKLLKPHCVKSLAGLPYGCYNAPPRSPLQIGIFLSKKPEVLAHRCVLSRELPLANGSGFAQDYGPLSRKHQHLVTDACRVTRPHNPLAQMRQLWRVFPASEPLWDWLKLLLQLYHSSTSFYQYHFPSCLTSVGPRSTHQETTVHKSPFQSCFQGTHQKRLVAEMVLARRL